MVRLVPRRCAFLALLACAWFLAAQPATAQDKEPAAFGSWPQWRGPNGTGVSLETGWIAELPAGGPKKLWEIKLGAGHSSPVLSQGKLYTLSTDPANPQKETVWCLDARTGKEVWKHAYEVKSVVRGRTPVGSTPAVVGDRVFTCGAGLNVHCLEAATGKVVWDRDLMKELPGKGAAYGFHVSPLPYEGLVIVAALTGAGTGKPKEPIAGAYAPTGGILLGLDQKTGKEVWRNTEGASAWSSPILATIEDKPTVVHLTGHVVLGINPADGKTRWKFDPKSVGLTATDMAASPLIDGNVIVAPVHAGPGAPGSGFKGGGFGAGTVCIKIKDGKPEMLWKNAKWGHWYHSAVLWKGCLYGYDEKSNFACFDMMTGTQKWKTRDLGTTSSGGGGFMLVDGKMLALDGYGQLIVAELSPTGHKLLGLAEAVKSASGFQFETAPLLLDGLVYCRNHTYLVCFDLRAKKD
jgi:outer membrane protein assembly factor BamB